MPTYRNDNAFTTTAQGINGINVPVLSGGIIESYHDLTQNGFAQTLATPVSPTPSGNYPAVTDPAIDAAVTQAIVDGYSGVMVTLTAAGNSQTIPDPTLTTTTKRFVFVNKAASSDAIDVNTITVSPGEAQEFVWDYVAWTPIEAVDAEDIAFIPVGGITEIDTQGAVAGVDNRKADLVLFTDADQPNGFVNRTDSSIAWSDAGPDRTLTIDKTNGGWSFYVVGTKFTKTAAEAIQIADVEGLHYIYYDSTGTLQETTTFVDTLMTQNAWVATVYWDATNNIGELMEERHGINMSGGVHLYLHHLVGAAYQLGLGLGDFVVDGDGSSNTHAQFSVAAGEIHDEDIEHITNAINSTTGLEIWYLDGANWRKTTNAGYSVLSVGGGNRLAYNNAGAQTEVTDNRYVLAHVFAWGAADGNPIAIQGQAQYTSLSAARDGAESEIAALNISGLPGIEMKAIGSAIFHTKDTFANAVKARVRSTDAGDNYIDFRTSPLGTGAPASEHGTTHVKDGSDEINGDRLDIDFTPANYTPSTSPVEVSDENHLAAHLAGIDDGLAQVGAQIGLIAGYGVRWNSSTDVMTAGIVSGGAFVAFDVSNFPVQEKMKRCVLDSSGVLQYYLHPDDSTLKSDGSAANLDGSDGQVMVEVKLFYYLICTDGNNKYFFVGERPFSFTLSDSSVKISKRHEWFEEGGTLSDKKYIGAYEGILRDVGGGTYVDGDGAGQYSAGDKVHSISGYKPLTYETRATFRTACAVDSPYHQMGFWNYEAILLLMLTEYQDWDSQIYLPGYTEDDAFSFADDGCKTGITNVLGNRSGSISWEDSDVSLRCSEDQTGLIVANSYRGIENVYGHLWKWVDGININFIGEPLTDADVYTNNDPATFADDTASNYIDEGFDLPLASGYQRDLHDGTLLPSSSSGGSSSTYITDYYWASSAAGWRVLLSGGALDVGADAGAAARKADNASSLRNAGIAGRSVA